ncbi:MAG: hypothetical protein IJH76_06470 [Clostridia bacterium]|nr:hypothetical protein [Clostridia bacterium]
MENSFGKKIKKEGGSKVTSLKELNDIHKKSLGEVYVSKRKPSNEIRNLILPVLEAEGIGLDLSKLELVYDGPAEEVETCCGTVVFNRPVWYGGIDSDAESFTLCVYQLHDKYCITLSRFFLHKHYEVKDLFVKVTA